MNSQFASHKEWKAEILRRLDIREEAEQLGVRFPAGAVPNDKGWLPCKALDREDANPSAAINVGGGSSRGWYRDYGGTKQSLPFFDIAVKLGRCLDWKAAQEYFAEKARIPKFQGRPAGEKATYSWKKMEDAVERIARKELGADVSREKAWYYIYQNADRSDAFRVVKFWTEKGKVCRPVRPVGDSWSFGTPKGQLVLFQLPELLAADPTLHVLIVEGEKDAETARELGFVATTNFGGAQGWRDSYAEVFRGRDVIIICDNDGAGRRFGEKVARSLWGIAASVRVIWSLPGVKEKGDLTDWKNIGGTKADLDRLIESAEVYSAPPAPLVAATEAPAVVLKVVTNYEVKESDEEPTTEDEQEAEGKPSDTKKSERKKNEKEERVPKLLKQIVDDILRVTGGPPYRVGKSLFVPTSIGGEIRWVEDPAQLIAYLGDQSDEPPKILESTGFHTKKEIFAHLESTAPSYRSIENCPHEPPLDRVFYNCHTPEPGRALKAIASESPLFPLSVSPSRSHGRGFIWTGVNAPAGAPLEKDLTTRMKSGRPVVQSQPELFVVR